jgi:predicted cobalt transporter CbtA
MITRFSKLSAVFVSVIVSTVMWIIAGVVVGCVMGRKKKCKNNREKRLLWKTND